MPIQQKCFITDLHGESWDKTNEQSGCLNYVAQKSKTETKKREGELQILSPPIVYTMNMNDN
jgi:hypothetical protein